MTDGLPDTTIPGAVPCASHCRAQSESNKGWFGPEQPTNLKASRNSDQTIISCHTESCVINRSREIRATTELRLKLGRRVQIWRSI